MNSGELQRREFTRIHKFTTIIFAPTGEVTDKLNSARKGVEGHDVETEEQV